MVRRELTDQISMSPENNFAHQKPLTTSNTLLIEPGFCTKVWRSICNEGPKCS